MGDSSNTLNMNFLKGLNQLPLIYNHLINYAQIIIKESKNAKEEQEQIEKIIEIFINEIKANKIEIVDIDGVKGGIRKSLKVQIEACKVANKFREAKNNPPPFFK